MVERWFLRDAGQARTTRTPPARTGAALVIGVLSTLLVSGVGVVPAAANVGHIKLFIPPNHTDTLGDIVAGPGRNVWFVHDTAIGRVTHTGKIVEYPLHTGYSAQTSIASDPGGYLWFPERRSSDGLMRMGRMTPTGAVSDIPLPTGVEAYALAAGPDGNLWFTANHGRIGRMSTSGSVRMFELPTPGAYAVAITGGPDGAVWFAEEKPTRIGRITPEGAITEYDLPDAMSSHVLGGITVGPDGNIWFTDSHLRGAIAFVRLDGSFGAAWHPTRTTHPSGITAGPDASLWYVAGGGNEVGRFALDGTFTTFTMPVESCCTGSIALGRDGDLWLPVGDNFSYAIARVDGA